MNRMQVIMWIALAVTIAIPVYFWRRSRDTFSGFDQLMAERHFTAQSSSPVAAFVGKDPPLQLHFYAAYAGQLRPQVPVTLMLFRRTEPVLINGVSVQTSTIYVGAYLPKVDTSWLKTWEDRASRKKDDVVYAATAAEGGAVVVWQGAPSQKNVARHLDELNSSISGS